MCVIYRTSNIYFLYPQLTLNFKHFLSRESEDTMLMILKEIYGSTGVQADAQLPQQTLCVERMSPSPSLSSSSKHDGAYGMDPTAPISERPIGPPPKSGFVKKS